MKPARYTRRRIVVAARFAAKYTEQGTIPDAGTRELMRKMREDMEQLEKGIDIMSTMKTKLNLWKQSR